MRVTNGIPLGRPLLLPVGTVNCVQTLKVLKKQVPQLRTLAIAGNPCMPALSAIARDGTCIATVGHEHEHEQEADGGGDGVWGWHSGVQGRMRLWVRISSMLVTLAVLDGRDFRNTVNPLWLLPLSVWTTHFTKHLSVKDVLALSATSHAGREVARLMPMPTVVSLKWYTGTPRLETIFNTWPKLKFKAVCSTVGELTARCFLPSSSPPSPLPP
jgi:hypothetical protein